MVDAVFIGLSILTIGSAIITLESKELLYGGIALLFLCWVSRDILFFWMLPLLQCFK